MNETKIKELLTCVNQSNRAKSQLKLLENTYHDGIDIPISASRQKLGQGIRYNGEIDDGHEHIVIPNRMYRQLLKDTIKYYDAKALELNKVINEGLKHD